MDTLVHTVAGVVTSSPIVSLAGSSSRKRNVSATIRGAKEFGNLSSSRKTVKGVGNGQLKVETVVKSLIFNKRQQQDDPVRTEQITRLRRLAFILFYSRRKLSNSAFVVDQRQADILEVVLALGAPCRFPRGLHCRQQQGDEHRDNRDDNQELYERKSPATGRVNVAHNNPLFELDVAIETASTSRGAYCAINSVASKAS